jgi:hypothetical protein
MGGAAQIMSHALYLSCSPALATLDWGAFKNIFSTASGAALVALEDDEVWATAFGIILTAAITVIIARTATACMIIFPNIVKLICRLILKFIVLLS